MDTAKIAAKLRKKLQRGDMKIISKMSKVKIYTVYYVMEDKKTTTKVISDEVCTKVFQAAIQLLKGREQDEYELNAEIEKL